MRAFRTVNWNQASHEQVSTAAFNFPARRRSEWTYQLVSKVRIAPQTKQCTCGSLLVKSNSLPGSTTLPNEYSNVAGRTTVHHIAKREKVWHSPGLSTNTILERLRGHFPQQKFLMRSYWKLKHEKNLMFSHEIS